MKGLRRNNADAGQMPETKKNKCENLKMARLLN
jgi:hypothetical protein